MKKQGFTIVELLVVISIIALLSSIAFVFLNDARARSRDARRLADLRNLESALGVYAAENSGDFPLAPAGENLDGVTDILSTTLIPADIITVIPTDPKHPDLVYNYLSNGNGYTFTFCLETDSVTTFARGCGNIISQ